MPSAGNDATTAQRNKISDEALARALADTTFQERDLAWYQQFAQCHIRAYVKSKSVKMDNYGDWTFTLVIPKETPIPTLEDVVKIVGMPIEVFITRTAGGKFEP